MPEPLDESYFNWLCAKVLAPEDRHIYLDLLRILYQTEFVWVVLGDQNRVEDGLELRGDFIRETQLYVDDEWAAAGCSVFEMLVALSKRAAFQTDISSKDWFWTFITNLELDEYRQVSIDDQSVISNILHNFIWRVYDSNGYGGLFPMRWPKADQLTVEIWYQFHQYLDEQGLF